MMYSLKRSTALPTRYSPTKNAKIHQFGNAFSFYLRLQRIICFVLQKVKIFSRVKKFSQSVRMTLKRSVLDFFLLYKFLMIPLLGRLTTLKQLYFTTTFFLRDLSFVYDSGINGLKCGFFSSSFFFLNILQFFIVFFKFNYH